MPPAKKTNPAAAWKTDLQAKRARARIDAIGELTFRAFLEAEDFGRPYLAARSPAPEGELLSPAVWAIIDATDGKPIPDTLARQLFQCPAENLPKDRNAIREVDISAGGRGGKTSTFLAPAAVHAAWTVPIPTLAPGERAVAAFLAPKRRTARQAFSMAVGLIKASPVLRAAVVHETQSSVTLRRPDGKEVTIEIVVAKPGGLDFRGFVWVFVGIDEAAFFPTGTAAINDHELVAALRSRLAPGARLWCVSTPWIEGYGYFMQTLEQERGRHENALVAQEVGTRLLNPWWDGDGAIERAIRARKPDGNEIADREILALPLPKGAQSLFSPAACRALLELHAPKNEMVIGVGAGIDLAFSQDSSALAVVHRYAVLFTLPPGGFLQEYPTKEKRLVPSEICDKFARAAKSFGATGILADNHYLETLREHTARAGLELTGVPNQGDKEQAYLAAAEVIASKRLALGDLEEDEAEDLIEQLLSVTRRPGPKGRITISAPRRKLADDGSGSAGHADAVSALVLALRAAGAGAGVAVRYDAGGLDGDDGDGWGEVDEYRPVRSRLGGLNLRRVFQGGIYGDEGDGSSDVC